jgi:hypothetical protein
VFVILRQIQAESLRVHICSLLLRVSRDLLKLSSCSPIPSPPPRPPGIAVVPTPPHWAKLLWRHQAACRTPINPLPVYGSHPIFCILPLELTFLPSQATPPPHAGLQYAGTIRDQSQQLRP